MKSTPAVLAIMLMAPLAHADGPPAAAPAEPALPPVSQRPVVVLDSIAHAGLLLPSAQQTAAAVVLALGKRYGQGFAVLEDESANTKKLRRMLAGMPVEPDQEKAQKARLALLDWAMKEAPYRVKVSFNHDGKKKAYVAAAECRERTSKTVIHRVEGTGKKYDDAIEDLKPKLETFCGVLDGVANERKKGAGK